MALTPKQELRHGQTLVMTPQLQQAIKLLQFSNLELAAFIESELESNPLLERLEPGTVEAEASAGRENGADRLWRDAAGESRGSGESLESDHDAVPAGATGPVFGDSGYGVGRVRAIAFDGEVESLEQRLSSAVTLRDHLLEQLHIDVEDPVDRMIGAYLVDMVDEAGYLAGDLESVARALGCSVERVEAALVLLQRFDPAGVFARNLSECLALQLAERDRLDPAMQALLDNLGLLAKADMAGLMRSCGVDAEDLEDMIAEVKALNPKPGLAFNTEVVHAMVPDVFVRQDPDGSWHVELNHDTLPKVLINARYCARVSGEVRSKQDRAYITEHLNSANWLIRSLDQRANTILRVAIAIVRRQEGFFAHGVEHMRPLTLSAVAEAVNMHESTVSRVTSNKYMATPRGTFELKYFFNSAIGSSDGGESHAAEAVRHRIRALIEGEGEAALSDDRIAEVLAREGVDIARRTVAKYREAMRIGSSVQRRRLKRQRQRA